MEITFAFKDAARPEEVLLVGNVTGDRGRYARLAGAERVFELSRATVRRIALQRSDLVTEAPTPMER